MGDVKPIAHALLNKFQNFYTMLNASNEDLLSIPNVTDNTVAIIRALQEALK